MNPPIEEGNYDSQSPYFQLEKALIATLNASMKVVAHEFEAHSIGTN